MHAASNWKMLIETPPNGPSMDTGGSGLLMAGPTSKLKLSMPMMVSSQDLLWFLEYPNLQPSAFAKDLVCSLSQHMWIAK